MPFDAQLDQTIDQVARSRITPPLTVIPTAIANPDNDGHGLLVIEVPESPDAPHMVGGIYYGRSETGRIHLDDAAVARLILRRGQLDDHLRAAMATTVQVDPEPDSDAAHFYITAVTAQGWTNMLLEQTRDKTAQTNFLGLTTSVVNNSNQDGARPEQRVCGALIDTRRTALQVAVSSTTIKSGGTRSIWSD